MEGEFHKLSGATEPNIVVLLLLFGNVKCIAVEEKELKG